MSKTLSSNKNRYILRGISVFSFIAKNYLIKNNYEYVIIAK